MGLFLSLPVLFFGQYWITLTPAGADESVKNWDFDALPIDTLPKDFVIGTLVDGRPAVVETDRAKSPSHVLTQIMGKGADHIEGLGQAAILMNDSAPRWTSSS